MKIVKFIVMLLLTSFCFVPVGFAQSTTSSKPMVDPTCIDSQEVCQRRAEKKEELRQRCLADPVWCKERKARLRQEREERRTLRRQCKENPDQCAALRKQFEEKRAQANRAKRKQTREQRQKLKETQAQWCIDNPNDCKRWKADWKALQKKVKEMRNKLQDQYPTRPR